MLLKKLAKKINQVGAMQVAIGLGYQSSAVFYYWFKKNKIPKLAEKKLKEYLNENK